MGYSGARGTLIYEKNLMSKISCMTPIKCLSLSPSYKSWSALPASLVQVPPLTSLTSTIWSFILAEAVLWSSASVSVWLFPPVSICRKFCSLFWSPAFSSSSLRSLRLRFFHLKETVNTIKNVDFLAGQMIQNTKSKCQISNFAEIVSYFDILYFMCWSCKKDKTVGSLSWSSESFHNKKNKRYSLCCHNTVAKLWVKRQIGESRAWIENENR